MTQTQTQTQTNPTVAVSAPGKVLLAGGYLVLDRQYTGLVFGLSARINVIASEIHTGEGVQLTEIVVNSPQFLGAQWRYGYHLAPEGGGIQMTQLQVDGKLCKNTFVETTLSYALTYISHIGGLQTPKPARLVILADDDYYSNAGTAAGRFSKFAVPLSGAHKTGLGSSAALVTALTGSLLTHYLPTELFDLRSEVGRQTLHNLAQAAHCAAQGKVGSGFDVAAAVYGSCRYRRFSPEILNSLPEVGSRGFSEQLVKVVSEDAWDVEVKKAGLGLPKGVALRMCDVDCGSQTVGMVKKVLGWRASDVDGSKKLWGDLQAYNDALAAQLSTEDIDALPRRLTPIRELIRQMSRASDVPIEPESQQKLLDALSGVEGVYGGVVPGAGGFDALAVLMRDDGETKGRVDGFLAKWSEETGAKVKLLKVKGEMEGVRQEQLDVYAEWL